MSTRVLSVYRTYYPDPPGGLQEAIKQICLSTSKYDVDNTIYTLSRSNKPKKISRSEGLVIRGKSWVSPASCDIGGLSSFYDFYQLAKQNDLIQYHFPWPFGDLLSCVVDTNKPSIVTYHSDIVRQKNIGKLYAPFMLKFLQKMDVVIATSPAYTETSDVLTHPSISNKVQVIPLGIDENGYTVDPDNNVYARLGINEKHPFFLFLGVQRYYKGLEYLVKASKDLEANIVIAGTGPEEHHLKKIADELGVTNIHFAGYVTHKEKVALLKACLALILPSHLRSEAFGMVLVEAALMGKPMISCEIGTGTSYVNKDQETGLVIPPASSKELNAAMKTLMQNESLVSTLGSNARSRYETLFSGEAMGRAYHELYQKLL